MADDKNVTGGSDGRQVSASDDYEVQDFAQKHGITTDQVRQLIARHGNNRTTLEAAVGQLAAS